MKRTLYIFIIIAMAYSWGCTPVRTFYTPEDKKATVKQQVKKADTAKDTSVVSKDTVSYTGNRFKDTTIIYLDPIEPGDVQLTDNSGTVIQVDPTPLEKLYNEALAAFDNKNYDAAEAKFTAVIESIDKKNPIFFDSKFYLSETRTVRNDFIRGESYLLELYQNTATPPSVMEKVLVRLGQIQCVRENEKLAGYYFERLKIEYPYSKYIELADCSFLKK